MFQSWGKLLEKQRVTTNSLSCASFHHNDPPESVHVNRSNFSKQHRGGHVQDVGGVNMTQSTAT